MNKIKLLLLNLGLLKSLFSDKRFGKWSKLIAIIAIIYLISPVDLVFDLTPVVGLLDDLVIIIAALASLRKLLKSHLNYQKAG